MLCNICDVSNFATQISKQTAQGGGTTDLWVSFTWSTRSEPKSSNESTNHFPKNLIASFFCLCFPFYSIYPMSFFYSICVLFHSLVHFLYSFCVLFVKSFNLFLMLVSTLCLSISFFFSCPFLYVFFLSFHLFLLCVCYLVCLSLYLISKMLFIPLTTNLCHLYFFVSPSSSSSTFFVHPPPNHWLQIVRGRAD